MKLFYQYKFAAIILFVWCACKPIPTLHEIPDSQSKPTNSNAAIIVLSETKNSSKQEVTIDWILPTVSQKSLKLQNGKVEIKLRIISKTQISIEQIEILFDGKPIGNKAGEVGLVKRPEFKDQIFTAQLPLPSGKTEVQIVVITAHNKRFFAEMAFDKMGDGIQLVQKPNTSSQTRVMWTQPDAFALKAHEMFNTKEKELEIKFNISAIQDITMQNIQVLINKNYKNPSNRAELIGSNGNYYFRDYIALDEQLPFNEVGLRIKINNNTDESQRLKINYSPSRPNVYVLAVGPKTNLKYSEKDARDFVRLYTNQSSEVYRLFNQVYIDSLFGGQATTQAIRIAIASIKTKLRTGAIGEDDLIILFFSSHGFMHEGELYIQADDYNSGAPTVTSIPYKKDILSNIEQLPCKKLLFIDACHGGGARSNVADINKALNDLKNTPKGLAVFASSSDTEESYEDVVWANGAFTECLIKGLKDGYADYNKNGIINFNEIERYITNEVPKIVKTVKNKSQHPNVTRNELGDIPIFVIPNK